MTVPVRVRFRHRPLMVMPVMVVMRVTVLMFQFAHAGVRADGAPTEASSASCGLATIPRQRQWHRRSRGFGHVRKSYGFRLIDSTLQGGFTRPCEADRLDRHELGDWTHGDGLQAFECGGAGRTVCWISGCHDVTALSGDLATGAWSHHLASIGDDGVWRTMDRTIARPL